MGPKADAVLDLEARRRIVEFVAANPGLHLRALADALAMPVSTLEYHCYHLVRHGHLSTREQGGFKSFYPGQGMDRRDKDVLALIRHRGPRTVCTHLLLHPGTTPGELRDVTGLSGPTLSFHLKKMRLAGLLREEAAGRTKRLFVEDPERVANVLVTYKRSFLDDAVDRFSEAWLALAPPEGKEETAPADAAAPDARAAAPAAPAAPATPAAAPGPAPAASVAPAPARTPTFTPIPAPDAAAPPRPSAAAGARASAPGAAGAPPAASRAQSPDPAVELRDAPPTGPPGQGPKPGAPRKPRKPPASPPGPAP